MCQLFETILIIDDKIQNIEFHQERFEKSYFELWGKKVTISLNEIICSTIKQGLVRAKFTYSQLHYEINYTEYSPKVIKSLQVVDGKNIDYSLKYLNRKNINSLYAKRNDCDDIIITKNGLITDTSIANLYFFDGKKWITPKTPLLNGTARQRLLLNSDFVEDDILISDIRKFQKIAISNALIGFTELPNIITITMIPNKS